jgi:hypothetical protein
MNLERPVPSAWRRDGDDAAVRLGRADQRLGEDVGVGGGVGGRLGLRARDHVELADPMALVARRLGGA